ncbi:hypothetical protein [Truepera radiovictrix]|nr:hypothetical protein [Truepera radiovictrix]WMT58598.1 hypothetical protein RCV51_06540 [Truepera radiovictrix]
MPQTYLVTTDYGDVLVRVNESCTNALEDDLLSLSEPTPEEAAAAGYSTPLRAFSAKMLDIIEGIGTGEVKADPKVIALLKKERATDELTRIERWAKGRRRAAGEQASESRG